MKHPDVKPDPKPIVKPAPAPKDPPKPGFVEKPAPPLFVHEPVPAEAKAPPKPTGYFVSEIAGNKELWDEFCTKHWSHFDQLTLGQRMEYIVRVASNDIREDDEQGRAILRAL